MKKRFLCALSILLILCLLTITTYAIEVPDFSRTGSISLNMTYQGEPIPGGSLTLYRVAEVQVANGADYSFRYVQAYEDCQADLSDLTTAGIAQEIADYTAAQAIPGITAQIDEEGCVTFPDLELGLYLLIQEEPADGFHAVNAFLVSVPGRQDEHYVYDVDASPKLSLEPAPTEPTEPPTEPTTPPDLPQTGLNQWPVPVLSISGLFLLVLGLVLYTAGKKKTHES